MTGPLGRLMSVTLIAALIGGCGGGGGSESSGNPPTSSSPPVSGNLVDFGVTGLAYSTSTISSTTSSSGGYTYRCSPTCETLTFKIGGVTLGAATGASTLSLKDFVGGIDAGQLSEATIRRAQFLMSIDGDADASNGISIPSELAPSLTNRSLDFSATSFDADLVSLIDYLRADGRLASSYRSGMQIPSRSTARAVAEQAEATARGLLIEAPTSSTIPVNEIRKYVLRIPDSLLVSYPGSAAAVKSTYSRGLRPAVGAGLSLISGTTTSNLQLRTVTARGIAVSAPRYNDGVLARPADVLISQETNGTPSIGAITLNASGADLTSLTTLKTSDGTAYSGRPTPTDSSGSDGARSLDEALQPRSTEFDQRGLDPAGVAEGDGGSVWICDRRGPFLVQLDAQNRSVQRLGPAGNAGALPDVNRRLPAILEARQAGLGCGGVAVRPTSGEVVFALGGVLNVGGRTLTTARLLRLVAFNPRNSNVRQFGIAIRSNEFNFRVLDLESLSEDRILALVRYREGSATGDYRWEIRTLDLSLATDISSKSLSSGPNAGLALEYGNAADIETSGVTLATANTVAELGALGWVAEAAEGLVRVNSQTLAVIGQMNGGVTSRIRGGDSSLTVAEHQVDRNGLITPRAAGGTTAPIFEPLPASVELRQTIVWTLQFRNAIL